MYIKTGMQFIRKTFHMNEENDSFHSKITTIFYKYRIFLCLVKTKAKLIHKEM